MIEKYRRIDDYGIIGDMETIALVGSNGSIDFFCYPDFDSPSIFARLLDHNKGGHFSLSPAFEKPTVKQMYLPDSNILLTRFLCPSGICELSDFMVVDIEGGQRGLIRRAKAVRGDFILELECSPRFNYARTGHTAKQKNGLITFTPDDTAFSPICLASDVDVELKGNDAVAKIHLEEGQSITFVLHDLPSQEVTASVRHEFVATHFKGTMNYWQRWIAKSNYSGRWMESVHRSALLLKLLTSKKHGSIVAAPTFGLPEVIGGVRNWDYRFTWIRDASFTLYGLMRLGFTEEAQAFMRWIEERCDDLDSDGSLQIMYGLDGRKNLQEEELPHFEGYMGSRPVRIGNAAYDQLQLDIYGELMDSVYLYDKYAEPISFKLWHNLTRLIEWVCANWHRSDEGIWEVRGGKREFLYSRLMCWVALDRAVRLALKRSLPAPIERWIEERNKIHKTITSDFWSTKLQSFVQYKGAESLDASNLLMPLVRFISPKDPQWLSTLAAISKNLVEDSLVFRYRNCEDTHDGLDGIEGTFNMCSFWYVECLARAGDVRQARFFFEKMLGYGNNLGLFAEELGTDGRQLGNYPQAFTHLALISAAYNLNRTLQEHRITW